MRKTPFAGLTVLREDESLLSDGGAFVGEDRDAIDRFLRIGAKTHKHDGSSGLPNPTATASGAIIGSGGQLPADISFSLGYTIEDATGGETMLSPAVTIATQPSLDPPAFQISAEADYSGGSLTVGTYYYAQSFLDAGGGETPIGPAVAVDRVPGFASGQVLLTDLAAGLDATAVSWRLYRSIGGGEFNLLTAGTGNDFTDDGTTPVDCDITPLTEDANSTNGDNSLLVIVPDDVGPVASAALINVYVSEDGTFVGDSLLDTYPIGSAGQQALYRFIDLGDRQPPDVNRSVGGASKLDPDTDLLDWHWLRPVTGSGALPSGAEGDVRVALDTGFPFVRQGSAWHERAGTVRRVSDNDSGVNDPNEVQVIGSGGIGATVTQSGGKAVVLIGGAPGGGGGPAGSGVAVNLWEPMFAASPPITDDFATDNLAANFGGAISQGFSELSVTGGHLEKTGSTVWSGISPFGGFDEPVIRSKFRTGTTPGDIDASPGGLLLGVNNGLTGSYSATLGAPAGTSLDININNGGSETVEDSAVIALDPSTDYWLELTRVGDLFTGNLYDADPDLNAPIATVTYTAVGAVKTFIGDNQAVYEFILFNTPNTGIAWIDDVLFDGIGADATTPLVSVPVATDIDLVAGDGILISLDESPSGHARIVISLAP